MAYPEINQAVLNILLPVAGVAIIFLYGVHVGKTGEKKNNLEEKIALQGKINILSVMQEMDKAKSREAIAQKAQQIKALQSIKKEKIYIELKTNPDFKNEYETELSSTVIGLIYDRMPGASNTTKTN